MDETVKELLRDSARQQQQILNMQAQFMDFQRDSRQQFEDARDELRGIKDLMEQSKGGWRVLLIIGGAGTTLAAGLAWIWVNILHAPIIK